MARWSFEYVNHYCECLVGWTYPCYTDSSLPRSLSYREVKNKLTSAIQLAFHWYFVILLTHCLHPNQINAYKIAFAVSKEKDAYDSDSNFIVFVWYTYFIFI